MASKTKFGSVNRFGPRYGIKIKKRLGPIEKKQKTLHQCPKCKKTAVKWQALAIWECKKCGAKFASKAFSFEGKPGIKESEDGNV